MTPETAEQTVGEAPLDDLVGAAEEEVRRLADLLSARGVLDQEASCLLAIIRARLLVAIARLRVS